MQIVYTIGYEGTDIDRFAATLKIVGINSLVDVRAVPLSRKRGFSKGALAQRCASEGIAYEHVPDLGDPKDGRDAARAGNYVDFRRIYGVHLQTSASITALESLAASATISTTCLMCFERDPLTCHRSLVGEKLKGRGLAIFHLSGDNPSRYERHAGKLSSHHPGEGAAPA